MIELTINFTLKFLHLIGLMLGAGAGFGAMAVARQARRAGGLSPDLAALRPQFARLALAGITLLWVSGLGLWIFRYDLVDLGPAWSLKLVVALVLLGIALALHHLNGRAQKAGTLPPAWLPRLGMATPVLTLVATALAVWIFI